MSHANGTRILPPGSQFSAIVDGKPTGLAGCTRADSCCRARWCLRADPRLPHRADMAHGWPTYECRAFIPSHEAHDD